MSHCSACGHDSHCLECGCELNPVEVCQDCIGEDAPPPMPEGWRWRDAEEDGHDQRLVDEYGLPVVSVSATGVGMPKLYLTRPQALYLAHVLKVWAETGEVGSR